MLQFHYLSLNFAPGPQTGLDLSYPTLATEWRVNIRISPCGSSAAPHVPPLPEIPWATGKPSKCSLRQRADDRMRIIVIR